MKIREIFEARYADHPIFDKIRDKSLGYETFEIGADEVPSTMRALTSMFGEPGKDDHEEGTVWKWGDHAFEGTDIEVELGYDKEDGSAWVEVRTWPEMHPGGLNEARYTGKRTPLYYFEFYPHYMGTMFRHFETSVEDIDSFIRDMESNPNTEDQLDDRIGDAFAIWDVIQNWPTVREEINKNGYWVDMWEEGTHALSTKGPHHAMEVVKNYERETVYNQTDQYDAPEDVEYTLSEFPDL